MKLPVAILAGGLATRLQPITHQIPKALVEVAGKPFAVHQLELLQRHSISQVVFCVGHLGEQIQAELGDGSQWNMHIQYVFDGPTLLGTGGALRKAVPLLGEAFYVLYGDTYLECDYGAIGQAFWDSHKSGKCGRSGKSGKSGLMTVFCNANQWDRSNVLFQNGQIVRYNKRQPSLDMQHIDYGLGVLHARALSCYPAGEPLDLATVYQDLLATQQLAGYEVQHRFYEIGSPTGLAETRRYLLEQ